MAKDRTRYFRIEARELLEKLSTDVLELERSPADTAIVARVLRHAHTLKGASANLRARELAGVAQKLEHAAAAGDADACRDAVKDEERQYEVTRAFLAAR